MSAIRELRSKPRAIEAPSYATWNTGAYLREYYSRVEPTERHTLAFLHGAIADLPRTARALDFGAGPTLHHAITLAGRVGEVHVADLLPQNLREIRRWHMRASDAHDWSGFTRETLRIEGVGATDADVSRREALVRHRLTRIVSGDARRRNPLGEGAAKSYDCVTTFFCADSATSSLGEWMRFMRNIIGLLAPGGLLVLGALRACEFWRIDDARLPSACIDERHVQFLLDAEGFDRAEQDIRICNVPDQAPHGFDSILLVAARARRVT